MKATSPPNEAERLAALRRYEILDTAPERDFDDITLLASHICEAPIALISLIDENRQWFKSKIGVTENETSREVAFCAHGILQPDVFEVTDALTDERFASNPMVTGEAKIRFYAGAPLLTPEGHALGMLCVKDRTTRELNPKQKSALQALSRQVVAQLELRNGLKELRQNLAERKLSEVALQQVHKKLMEASRQAGMAEVATGVLHNVGNVLNSVNVASSYMADNLRKSKLSNLSKVVTLLREHESDLETFLTQDPKGKQLPAYLSQLAEHLAGEQAAALDELAQLQKNIDHIKDIVTMQQSFAKISGIRETLAASDLVEDALKMNSSGLLCHGIKVIRDFGHVKPISVEKHKVMQILVNMVRNARQACDETERPDKCLIIRLANDNERVLITVADNGIGIASENLTRIFAHGFTTKKDGHGFGLHSGALAAKEMGGSLTVHSDGLNCGSRFTLELPRLEVLNKVN